MVLDCQVGILTLQKCGTRLQVLKVTLLQPTLLGIVLSARLAAANRIVTAQVHPYSHAYHGRRGDAGRQDLPLLQQHTLEGQQVVLTPVTLFLLVHLAEVAAVAGGSAMRYGLLAHGRLSVWPRHVTCGNSTVPGRC